MSLIRETFFITGSLYLGLSNLDYEEVFLLLYAKKI